MIGSSGCMNQVLGGLDNGFGSISVIIGTGIGYGVNTSCPGGDIPSIARLLLRSWPQLPLGLDNISVSIDCSFGQPVKSVFVDIFSLNGDTVL